MGLGMSWRCSDSGILGCRVWGVTVWGWGFELVGLSLGLGFRALGLGVEVFGLGVPWRFTIVLGSSEER